MMRWRTGVLASALLTALSGQVQATVFAPADLTELLLTARAIVHGVIVDLHPQASDNRRRVDTLVTLQVSTYLKGNFGPTVTFRVPGGQLGRYRTVVLGAPRFVPGEEVVLLLSAQGPSIPYVLGLNQGVFRIVRDPVTGERRVTPAPLVGEGAEWKPVVRGDPMHAAPLLTEFARHVQHILGGRP